MTKKHWAIVGGVVVVIGLGVGGFLLTKQRSTEPGTESPSAGYAGENDTEEAIRKRVADLEAKLDCGKFSAKAVVGADARALELGGAKIKAVHTRPIPSDQVKGVGSWDIGSYKICGKSVVTLESRIGRKVYDVADVNLADWTTEGAEGFDCHSATGGTLGERLTGDHVAAGTGQKPGQFVDAGIDKGASPKQLWVADTEKEKFVALDAKEYRCFLAKAPPSDELEGSGDEEYHEHVVEEGGAERELGSEDSPPPPSEEEGI